jgi:hypothetical protein
MAFDFGAARWKSLDMPFPLIAAALGAAGNLAGAFMNQNAASGTAKTARRAGTLVSQASLKAGNMGANASTQAANVGATAATQAASVGATAAQQAAHQQFTGYGNAIDQTQAGTNQALGYLQPFAQAGQGSTNLLANALGANGPAAQAAYYQNFQTDPGFMATQQAGVNALDREPQRVGNCALVGR